MSPVLWLAKIPEWQQRQTFKLCAPDKVPFCCCGELFFFFLLHLLFQENRGFLQVSHSLTIFFWGGVRENNQFIGHGNPLLYPCLENPMDRGAWQAMVHGVTESQTRLKQLSTSTHKSSTLSPKAADGICLGPPLLNLFITLDINKKCPLWNLQEKEMATHSSTLA